MSGRRERRGRPFAWIALGLALIVISIPVGLWMGVVVPREREELELRRRLAAATEDFHRQRWQRPVLRGEPIDGDAHEAQARAIRPLRGLPEAQLGQLGDILREGREPPAEIRALLADNAQALQAYRDTTRHRGSWGDYEVERGLNAVVPDYRPHLHAARALLATADASEPAECLRIVADVVRLGQDRAAGRSLLPFMVRAAHTQDVLAVGGRCLARADRTARRSAARELAILVSHPAPTGHALEVEALLAGHTLAELVDRSPTLPASFGDELRRWLEAGDALEAWELLMGEPAERRAVGQAYPSDLSREEARDRRLAASGNPLLAAGPELARYLRRDAAARAAVRMLWVAASALSESGGALRRRPPGWLSDPRRVDPMTGRPFEWVPAEETITLRSPGADGSYGPDPRGEVDDLVLVLPRHTG